MLSVKYQRFMPETCLQLVQLTNETAKLGENIAYSSKYDLSTAIRSCLTETDIFFQWNLINELK